MLPETNDFSIFTTISPFLYIDCLYIVYLYIISNIYLCQGILSPYLTSFFHFNRKKYAQNSSFQNRSVHSFLFSFYFSFSVLLFTRIFQLYSAIMQSSPAFSKTSFSLPFQIRTVTFFSVSEESQASAFPFSQRMLTVILPLAFRPLISPFVHFSGNAGRIVITPSWL